MKNVINRSMISCFIYPKVITLYYAASIVVRKLLPAAFTAATANSRPNIKTIFIFKEIEQNKSTKYLTPQMCYHFTFV